jgi:hypothetical protein
MRKLGKVQIAVLRAMRSHGKWRRNGGWYWGCAGETQRILDGLVARGLVTKGEDRWGDIYEVNAKGRFVAGEQGRVA